MNLMVHALEWLRALQISCIYVRIESMITDNKAHKIQQCLML